MIIATKILYIIPKNDTFDICFRNKEINLNLKCIFNEMQNETKYLKFFLRKWKNSIHSDKIGKMLLKLQFLKQILKFF